MKRSICAYLPSSLLYQFNLVLSLSPEPLRVTLSPKNLKTGISSTVILSCAVQGSPHFTVSWYRNTEPVLPDQHFSIQGAHNETLFISAAQKRHSGAYQCFATRRGQTAQDFSIILLEGAGYTGMTMCRDTTSLLQFNCISTNN